MPAKTYTVRGQERAPVDRQTAIALSGGYEFKAEMKLPREQWAAPPGCSPPPPAAVNLMGSRRGRMQIVGYLETVRSGDENRHKWLARCDCGMYERRDAVIWRKGLRNETTDACGRCEITMRVKRRDLHQRTGDYGDNEAGVVSPGSARMPTVDLTAEEHRALALHRSAPRALVMKHTPLGRAQRRLIALGLIAPERDGAVTYAVTARAALL